MTALSLTHRTSRNLALLVPLRSRRPRAAARPEPTVRSAEGEPGERGGTPDAWLAGLRLGG